MATGLTNLRPAILDAVSLVNVASASIYAIAAPQMTFVNACDSSAF